MMKKALLRAVAIMLLIPLVLVGCQPPTIPTPSPTPSISPTSPSPGVGSLRATPQGFVDATGKVVQLRGVSYIPPDSKLYGWPTFITEDILDEIARAGGNFVAVRLGPFSRDGEGMEWVAYESVGDHSRVNLDQWNPGFWGRVRTFVDSARSRGIYVEFDLIDAWVLERPELSPWDHRNNVNGYDGGNCHAIAANGPDDRQKQWLLKIIQEVAPAPNVLFQISNESGDGNCRGLLNPQWEIGVYEFLKANGVNRPVGTNSHDHAVEGRVDYVERHGCSPVSLSGKPAGVNEWNCAHSAEDFCRVVREADRMGSWFLLWGDGMDRAEWDNALKCLSQ